MRLLHALLLALLVGCAAQAAPPFAQMGGGGGGGGGSAEWKGITGLTLASNNQAQGFLTGVTVVDDGRYQTPVDYDAPNNGAGGAADLWDLNVDSTEDPIQAWMDTAQPRHWALQVRLQVHEGFDAATGNPYFTCYLDGTNTPVAGMQLTANVAGEIGGAHFNNQGFGPAAGTPQAGSSVAVLTYLLDDDGDAAGQFRIYDDEAGTTLLQAANSTYSLTGTYAVDWSGLEGGSINMMFGLGQRDAGATGTSATDPEWSIAYRLIQVVP